MKPSQHEAKEFGRLLTAAIAYIAACEGVKTASVEDDLGERLNVAGTTLQRYKAGHVPSDYDMVELLAEEIMKRSSLPAQWLKKFLRAARHPGVQAILERFATSNTESAPRSRHWHNLPNPDYIQFVSRSNLYTDIIQKLQFQGAGVVLHGLGGTGKTSLALYISYQCFSGSNGAPQFDAIAWISDKGRNGKTNLNEVLDTVARILDFPGHALLDFHAKQHEIDLLLRENRILVVIDNFETITDMSLLDWMIHLPQPSKGIITTREFNRLFRATWSTLVGGMNEEEAQLLIVERLRFLGISHLGSDLSQFTSLLDATGGNPLAIGMALGQVKHDQRPVQEVIGDIYQARGELFDSLFARAWTLLNDPAKRILMAMTLFSGSVSKDALSAVANVQNYDYDQAIERLLDLALLDTIRTDLKQTPRYSLHALVRSFATVRLSEHMGVEQQFYERWVNWYVQFANKLEDAKHHLDKLDQIELEEATFDAVIQWCYKHKRQDALSQIADVLGFYYHVRGQWEKKPTLHLWDAEIAKYHQDYAAEAKALAYLVQLLARQEKLSEAYEHLKRLRFLVASTELSSPTLIEYLIAEGYYGNIQGQPDAVLALWQKYQYLKDSSNGHMVRTGIADCLYNQGNLVEARILYETSLRSATEQNIQRGVISIQLKLTSIYLDLDDIDQAEEALNSITHIATSSKDRRYEALLRQAYARFYHKRGLIQDARDALAEATDLFKRLGMRREWQQASDELKSLDSGLEFRSLSE